MSMEAEKRQSEDRNIRFGWVMFIFLAAIAILMNGC